MTKIGIVGTYKNTGKTTTLISILNEIKDKKVALTSIGFDGEDIDNLTFLPKPKIVVFENLIVATSFTCLQYSKIKYEIIHKTGILTPLGEIYIIRVISSGELVIAGPNNTKDLSIVLSIFENLLINFCFVDGAMNRIAPMHLLDKIIFSTGAAKNQNIDILSEEMETIFLSFQFKLLGIENNFYDRKDLPFLEFQTTEGEVIKTDIITLYNDSIFKEIMNTKNISKIFIPNIFNSDILKTFIKKNKNFSDLKIILPDPFKLLLAFETLNKYEIEPYLNYNIFYRTKPELIAITVNPFYPKYENYHYTPGYIDKKSLLLAIKSKVSIPVINIFETGAVELLHLIL